ncbi:MAG: CNP1-like family protein [Pseudomonadota bacterium]
MKKFLLTMALLLPLAAQAQSTWGSFDREFEADKPWVEVAAQLPAYPKAENLVEFAVSSATRNRHAIDTASISVGEDKVVRYTVVIDAAGGARNVSFEGMRCETRERRLYAYGQADGTWSKARSAGWEPIKLRSLLSYHKPLFEEFFCPGGISVHSAAEAVRNLKQARY